MKGKNDLVLNEDTVCEALQEWVNKRMGVFAPKVLSVKYSSNAGGYYTSTFTVSTERLVAHSSSVHTLPPQEAVADLLE